MADLFIALGMIGIFAVLVAAYALRTLVAGRVRHARTDADGGSVFLNKPTMEMVYWILDPIIDFVAALRITPNMVTLFSLLPALGAGVAIGFGWFGLATALAVLSTFCDIIDGLLARKTGLSSGAGEVIDAAADRYGELFMFGGLVYYYRTHDQVLFIVLAALAASFMVSYATAKAEAMGVPAPRGAMRRGERAVGPSHAQPAVGEIEPRLGDARQAFHCALDFADAGAAGDALDGELHGERAVSGWFGVMREVKRLSHNVHRKVTRLRERNNLWSPR